MRHFDLSPFYRSTVGFDRLFNLLDGFDPPDSSASAFPPYNIERTGENEYRISMAVAGFSEDDLQIEAKENTLSVSGRQSKDGDSADQFLFQGIAARNFERRFQLADYVEVRQARLENGLLHIDLVRELPEAMRARKIAISGGSSLKKKAKKILA